jgi:dsRNA-specific ribonuclease
LHDLESAAIKLELGFPVLSPLVLESVLTMPSTGMKDLAFDAYRAIGSKVLGLLTAVTAHARTPSSHHKHVRQNMIDMFPRDKLARLIRIKFPMSMLAATMSELDVRLWAAPGTRGRQNQKPVASKIPNNEDLANIAEAFVGAYFSSEGTFFSAWQFLLWLQQEEVGQDISEVWEEAVLGHLLFGSGVRFHGRTQTYLEIQEVVDGSEKILRVLYEVQYTKQPSWIEYRRSGPNRKLPEERRGVGADNWEPLFFAQKDMTFVSKHGRVVPGKVNSWLLGGPFAPLATVKPYKISGKKSSDNQTEFRETPEYAQLLEKRTGELWVNYRDCGWFIYSRSDDGNLGLERKAEASRTSTVSMGPSSIQYSETLKTFKSSILKKPLPNKVGEWLHHHKCLAHIVTPKKTEFDACRVIDEKSEVKSEEEDWVVNWSYNDGHANRCFECSVDVEPRGSAGVVMLEREITDLQRSQEKEELIYSEVMKTWLSPALTKTIEHHVGSELWLHGVPVPSRVMESLKRFSLKATREPSHMCSAFRTQFFKVPWSVVPHFIRSMVPRTIDLAEVEAHLLKYTFRNPMMLLEALTHSSCRQSITPPNTRLATIGRWLVETMLTEAVIKRTRFPMQSTRPAEEDVEAKEPSQTWAVSALRGFAAGEPDHALRWPRVQSATVADKWLTKGLRTKDGEGTDEMLTDSDRLLEWVNACCNHVTYAYICCQTHIHKHISHSSKELEVAITDFARVAHHASAKPEVLWLTLSARDAPRALSDTFLAVAAAVFLDSDWNNFHRVFEPVFKDHVIDKVIIQQMTSANGGPVAAGDPVSHLQRLAGSEGLALAVLRVPPPVAGVAQPRPCTWKSVLKMLANEQLAQDQDPCCGLAFDATALSLCYTQPLSMEPPRQCEFVGELPDLHVFRLWLGGIPVGPPVRAASPRSAARRCASLALPGLTAEDVRSVKKVMLKAASPKEARKSMRSALIELERLREPVGDDNSRQGAEVETVVDLDLVLHPPKNLDRQFMGVDAAGKLPDPELGRGADDNRGVPEDSDAGHAQWCPECEMWLNGPTQMEDHKIGKKHRKNSNKSKTEVAAGSKTTTEVAAGSKQGGTPKKAGNKGSKQPSATKSAEVNNKVPDGCMMSDVSTKGNARTVHESHGDLSIGVADGPPSAPPAAPAPCSIQQRGPPSPKMPIDGGDRQHADGGRDGSVTQHEGIAQGSMKQEYIAALVWLPGPPAAEWNGGGLPTQVQGCNTMPTGWIQMGQHGWFPAAPWHGDGILIEHAQAEYRAR